MPAINLVDSIIIVVYILAVAGFGVYFYRRSRSIEGFALAGRSLPGWALGISILGTYLSSISFLANAGKTYSGDWNPFVFSLTLPVAAIVASLVFIPFYRRAEYRTAYQHLEARFGYWARGYASACLILLQISRIAVVLYLVVLAMDQLLGWQGDGYEQQVWLMVGLGVLTILYTVVGGMEAVVWTDVVQTIVLTIGALFCVFLLIVNLPVSLGEAVELVAKEQKMGLGSFELNGWQWLVEKGFWLVFLFGIIENLRNFGVDQNYVQRMLAAKTDRDAHVSLWIGALVYIPLSAVFFFIGTLLWLFYTQQPVSADFPSAADQVFPYFIVHELPSGVMGLVIAAVLAAGMSTLDSSINASANVWVTDFYSRFKPSVTDQQQLRQIRWVTVVIGALGIGFGLLMIGGAKATLDVWWQVSAALGGGMLGVFLLAVFCPSVSRIGSMIGVVSGIMVVSWGSFGDFPFDSLAVAPLATATILVIGLLSSVIFKRDKISS